MTRIYSPKAILSLFTLLCAVLFSNPIFAQYNDVNFGGSGVTITNYPSGSDGTDQGDIILYENVATINSQSIDCYVVVDSVTGSSISTPDQNATSGSGYSNNNPAFFAPFLNLPSGGGIALFSFQFIQDGSFSYNSTSGVISATKVTIDSVRVNSYDIDGNGATNSNQFTEFGGFSSSELHTSTNLAFTTSTATGLTRWVSTLTANTSNVTAQENRIRVLYDTMSTFQIAVGAGSSGWAYFFLEFASGNTFSPTQIYYQVLGNVLNDTNGLHNDTYIDGTGIGTASGTQLYANLVNSGDSVLQSVAVNADGSYSFNVVEDGSYNVILTSSALTVNSTNNNPSLPTNWENTGENIGVASGNDGTVDGKIALTVNGANVTNVNFGVNKRPETQSVINTINSPSFGDTLNVAATTLVGGGTGNGLHGTDDEDGTMSSPSTIHITALPVGTNKLLYDGNLILVGQDGTNPPSTTNPYVINNFDQSKLQFVVTIYDYIEFSYAVVDNAGLVDLTPAVYNYNWSTPVPVEFLFVKASLLNNNEAKIEWSTATEINNSHFEVLRLDESTNTYVTIGTLPGAGTSIERNDYSYIDNLSGISGEFVYYKVKQTDYDGSSVETNSVFVQRTEDQAIHVYPNPANNEVAINFTFQSKKHSMDLNKAELLSLDGRVLDVVNFNNQETVQFNTQDLTTGVYIVQLNINGVIHSEKFLVKH